MFFDSCLKGVVALKPLRQEQGRCTRAPAAKFISEEKIMKRFLYSPSVLAGILLLGSLLSAQQSAVSTSAAAVVPRLVNFSGKAIDQGKAVAGVTGITFAIYNEESDGSPLWLETQNVQADSKGNYSVQLGATKSEGLPLDLFTSGEARWLGVRINGGEEQPRVLLLSVPYALKAADAQTLGGLPASAFLLAAAPVTAGNGSSPAMSAAQTVAPAVSGTGTTDFLPLWTNSTGTLANSVLFQTGSGTTAKVGINTTAPAATLDVNGTETVRGLLNLAATGTATATAGKNSQPQDFTASAFNSSTSTAVSQKFQWQAEATGNNTATASGAMSLLYATGTAAPAETGLKINSKGLLTFAAGQAFPGTGKGTVTSVGLSAPTTDFTVSGSPITGSGTLALKWHTAPTANDTANAIVKRDSTASFSAGSINVTALNANNTGGLAIIANSSGDAAILGGSSSNSGVAGTSVSGDGVFGDSIRGNGVEGDASGPDGFGVYGTNTAEDSIAIYGIDTTASSAGVVGIAPYAVIANGSILAGEFIGNVEVEGSLSKDSGSFKIDHPLDPGNKYLYHSFVESPDMMNIYNGNVITDAQGNAVISLPDWFEALNRDFRYQLTVVGQFAQAIVSSKVANHQFAIKTDKPSVEVSWQVTGIRQDAWANAHRIPVEEMKSGKERGFYRHPELYNAPAEKSLTWARHPHVMKHMNAARTSLPSTANTAKKEAPTPAKP
jgi:trimeric autotransporter adhesin